MLHYSCDLCKRPIDVRSEMRHVVKIEVFQAVEEGRCEEGDCCEEGDIDEIDHLDEVHAMLERIEESQPDDECDAFDDNATRVFRFDLCEGCRTMFLKNPLGGRHGKKLDFSNN